MLLYWVVLDESVAAVDLNRLAGHALGYLRGKILGHRGFTNVVQFRVLQASSVVNQEARRLDVGRHLGQRKLHCLKLRDRLAELLPLLRVFRRMVPGTLREAEHLGSDTDPSFVQGLNSDLVSLAGLAQYVLFGHAAVFEDQLACRGSSDAQLVFFLAYCESGKILLHKKGSDAFVSGRRIKGRENDEEASLTGVGDPELLAIEHVFAAALLGSQLEREGI